MGRLNTSFVTGVNYTSTIAFKRREACFVRYSTFIRPFRFEKLLHNALDHTKAESKSRFNNCALLFFWSIKLYLWNFNYFNDSYLQVISLFIESVTRIHIVIKIYISHRYNEKEYGFLYNNSFYKIESLKSS